MANGTNTPDPLATDLAAYLTTLQTGAADLAAVAQAKQAVADAQAQLDVKTAAGATALQAIKDARAKVEADLDALEQNPPPPPPPPMASADEARQASAAPARRR